MRQIAIRCPHTDGRHDGHCGDLVATVVSGDVVVPASRKRLMLDPRGPITAGGSVPLAVGPDVLCPRCSRWHQIADNNRGGGLYGGGVWVHARGRDYA